ncbi:MAG: DUF4145 domain-containing protein [Candidatus Marinimicrobia bacterium]|nr:DUF4145 domain-containing protein [Candidatus Neomarinimicrobiota bacterium]MCF7880180.1 DUF4145 domain-containing protein [Candidatus Neomarinimicrobiota bacterium]
MCASILESTLKDRLTSEDEDLLFKESNGHKTRKEKNFIDLINTANHINLIDKATSNTLHKIRKSRNRVVHELESIGEDEAYNIIMQTKDVIEGLYK